MKSQYVLPVTIVIAGALIATAVFWLGKTSVPTTNTNTGQIGKVNAKAVDATDHILGNPNAKVKVVEYADLECPYCKVFHTTMHQIMDYYGQSGDVAWVYRPFPLGQIHSKAPKEAEAAECAADQGGNTAFFNYVDKLYSVTPGENNLDLAQLPIIAKDVGLNVETFNTCLNSGKNAAKVQASYNDATAAGGNGTPYILVMAPDGSALTLNGAQPYDSMRAAIDTVLSSVGGASPQTSTTTTTTP